MDYSPQNFPQDGKVKKGGYRLIAGIWKLKKNIDLLKNIDKNGIYSIGFKAEMDKESALQNEKSMLLNKNVDGVCLNILDETNQFGSDTNSIDLITKNNIIKLTTASKLEVSITLLESLKGEFSE